ncbi:MAG: Sporulation initiation inhibitor protein Soj [Bacteroides sp.]
MRNLVVTNQKGGVGKTVYSVHQAAALVDMGKKVLFIDLDTQRNSSKTIKKFGAVTLGCASSLFLDSDFSTSILDQVAQADKDVNLFLIEGDSVMADVARADPKVMVNYKRNLAAVTDAFDFAVVDTAPSLSIAMSGALIAANYVISPIELEEYSIDGVTDMLKTIFGVRQKWNPDLVFLGMFPNRFNPRSERQKETLAQLLENYAHLVIPAKIGLRASIPEALAEGIPVWKLRKTSAREAAKEFAEVLEIVFKKMEVGSE